MRATLKNIVMISGLTAALGAASAASADEFFPQPSNSVAAAPKLDDGVYFAGQGGQLDQIQFLWGGRNYCWYPGGWHGPGYYWCGYAWHRGYGWGGPVGWHGWRGGGGYGHGYHGGGHGGFHGGGNPGGGHPGGEHGGGDHRR